MVTGRDLKEDHGYSILPIYSADARIRPAGFNDLNDLDPGSGKLRDECSLARRILSEVSVC